MLLPVQVTIRNIPSSPALETHIRKKAQKLKQFYDHVNRCKVVVELPKKHLHQGKVYNVRIDIFVPGKQLVSTHKCDPDVYVAIRDSFNAIERQLEEYSRKRHGQIKTHHEVLHGYITHIVADEGYGFIDGIDGHHYYFSLTNVHYPSFNQLIIGDAVEYVASPVNEGWQAHHIIREKNHHRQVAIME